MPTKTTLLGWFGATLLAAVVGTAGVITYVYANFETKDTALLRNENVIHRLERIENKIDELKK